MVTRAFGCRECADLNFWRRRLGAPLTCSRHTVEEESCTSFPATSSDAPENKDTA